VCLRGPVDDRLGPIHHEVGSTIEDIERLLQVQPKLAVSLKGGFHRALAYCIFIHLGPLQLGVRSFSCRTSDLTEAGCRENWPGPRSLHDPGSAGIVIHPIEHSAIRSNLICSTCS
jgi:hypothetical protein